MALVLGCSHWNDKNQSDAATLTNPDSEQLWHECNLDNIVSKAVFSMALSGYNQMDQVKNKEAITIKKWGCI
jgi:hypothetical protein